MKSKPGDEYQTNYEWKNNFIYFYPFIYLFFKCEEHLWGCKYIHAWFEVENFFLEGIRCWIVDITEMPTFIKLLLLNKRCNIKGTLRAEMHYSWQEATDRNWMMEPSCSTHFNSLCVRRVCGQVCVPLMKVLTVWPFSICTFIFSSSSVSCSWSACNLRQTHTKKAIKSGFELCHHDVLSRSLLALLWNHIELWTFAKIKTLIFGFETGQYCTL